MGTKPQQSKPAMPKKTGPGLKRKKTKKKQTILMEKKVVININFKL